MAPTAHRDHLAELFWGDRPERKARRSLSTALRQIHRCLPRDDLLLGTASTIQFNPETPLWLDVQAFEVQAARPNLVNLQAAVDLYRGDFLNGFYDDWVIGERYRLESILLDVLARLMTAQGMATSAKTLIDAGAQPVYGDMKDRLRWTGPWPACIPC